jgi:Hemocyanin, copper containing domain
MYIFNNRIYVFQTGYAPHVSYMNGDDFPVRPENMNIANLEDITVGDVIEIGRRTSLAINTGYFYDVRQLLCKFNLHI